MAKKTKEVQEQPVAQPTAQAEQPAGGTPGLSVQDLIGLAQIIQVTNQRGAYRPEEMVNVGTLYNKLIAFLQSVGAIQQPEQATEEK